MREHKDQLIHSPSSNLGSPLPQPVPIYYSDTWMFLNWILTAMPVVVFITTLKRKQKVNEYILVWKPLKAAYVFRESTRGVIILISTSVLGPTESSYFLHCLIRNVKTMYILCVVCPRRRTS